MGLGRAAALSGLERPYGSSAHGPAEPRVWTSGSVILDYRGPSLMALIALILLAVLASLLVLSALPGVSGLRFLLMLLALAELIRLIGHVGLRNLSDLLGGAVALR